MAKKTAAQSALRVSAVEAGKMLVWHLSSNDDGTPALFGPEKSTLVYVAAWAVTHFRLTKMEEEAFLDALQLERVRTEKGQRVVRYRDTMGGNGDGTV